jgi:hypothetical protein
MLEWLNDLPSSVRAVSYFLPREEVMARVGHVMQTGQALYLACHVGLTDWDALFGGLGISSLAELDEAAYLILDDCDVLDSDTLMVLVRTLVQETRGVRLILFGHRPLIDLYADPILTPVYQCFIDATRIDSPYEDHQLVLYVEAFGHGRAFVNGHPIHWNGLQQLETFFVMLDLMPATTETLLMALFGSTSEEAYSKFHVSKTTINRILGRDFTTIAWGAHPHEQAYYLSDKITLYSDFREYGKLIRQMFDQTASTETILECSEALLRFSYHDYVAQITTNAYIAERRMQLRYYLSQSLVQVGRSQWHKGRCDHAEALLTRATQADRSNRDAVEMLMALYHQQGREQEAALVYQRWQEARPAQV